MKDRTILGITAILAVMVIELYALSRNVDGTVLAAVVAAISALGGAMLTNPKASKTVLPAAIGFTIEIDATTMATIAVMIAVFALVYTAFRLSRIPHDFANGFADSMAELAKESNPNPEAFAHLQETISEAVRTRSWTPLVGLVGNPIAIKAFANLRPMLAKLGSGMGTQPYREFAAGD